jgi:hypothetical protein
MTLIKSDPHQKQHPLKMTLIKMAHGIITLSITTVTINGTLHNYTKHNNYMKQYFIKIIDVKLNIFKIFAI